MKLTLAASLLLLVSPAFVAGQTAEPTAKLTPIQKYNPFRVEGGPFEQRLFQADAMLRLGDSITTHRTVFDKSGRFYETDPIAPGQNHSVVLAYAFQMGAHIGVVQAHNLLVRKNHPKLARALVVADIAMEAYTVGLNIKHEREAAPVAGSSISWTKLDNNSK